VNYTPDDLAAAKKLLCKVMGRDSWERISLLDEDDAAVVASALYNARQLGFGRGVAAGNKGLEKKLSDALRELEELKFHGIP